MSLFPNLTQPLPAGGLRKQHAWRLQQTKICTSLDKTVQVQLGHLLRKQVKRRQMIGQDTAPVNAGASSYKEEHWCCHPAPIGRQLLNDSKKGESPLLLPRLPPPLALQPSFTFHF